MSAYTVQSGQTLSQIVKEKFGISGWTEIKKKCEEIKEKNNLKDINTIFAGSILQLDESDTGLAVQRGAAPSSIKPIDAKSVSEQPKAIAPATTEIVPEKTTPLNDWTNECANSMIDVDKDGKPVYGRDVEDFDMAGDKFREDLKTNGGKNAGEIYKQKAIETAKGDIGLFDKDGDGMINPEEQVKRDKAEYEKKYGKMDAEFSKTVETLSLRANIFMDIDKNGKVDEKEYAAFLYAMDANNDKKIANGKLTREEYTKSTSYFEKPLDQEAGTFRGSVRAAYKGLFGFDPAAK